MNYKIGILLVLGFTLASLEVQAVELCGSIKRGKNLSLIIVPDQPVVANSKFKYRHIVAIPLNKESDDLMPMKAEETKKFCLKGNFGTPVWGFDYVSIDGGPRVYYVGLNRQYLDGSFNFFEAVAAH